MIATISILTLVPLLYIALIEIGTCYAVGRYIKSTKKNDKRVNEVISKSYKAEDKIIFYLYIGDKLPFISSSLATPLSKWYIHSVGRITRWSKYHKIMEERYKELSILGEEKLILGDNNKLQIVKVDNNLLLQEALDNEDYERAAYLRDKLTK